MATIGELVVNLKANTAAFATDLKKASSLAFGTSREIGRSFQIMGGVAVAGLGAAAAGLFAIAERTARYGEEIQNAAQKTGIGVEELQGLKFAAEQAELPFDALQVALKKFSVNISGIGDNKKFSQAMQAIGLDAKAMGKDLYADLIKVSGAFERLPAGPLKAAAAVAAFGKAGNDMIPFLDQGPEKIRALMEQASLLGIVISKEDIPAAAKLADQLEMLATQSTRLQYEIGTKLTPNLVVGLFRFGFF